jgi:hypothetical protein
MLLRRLQETLGRIYDLSLQHDVCEFLVTDRASLGGAQLAIRQDSEEELLVRQEGEDVRIALFVDRCVLERLSWQDPLVALHAGNLADFWTALEGVSHFQYLTWNAGLDRPVSIHELEVQAEVDKYALTLFLLGAQQAGRFPQRLHHWLFERARVDCTLTRQKRELYASANRYAARFCRALEDRYLRRGRVRCEALVRELRHFYRLTHAPKIRLIEIGRSH